MEINKTFKINLDQTIDELRDDSIDILKNSAAFENYLKGTLGIYDISLTMGSSHIFIDSDGDVRLYIKVTSKISNVLNDLTQLEVENIHFFRPERAGLFKDYIQWVVDGQSVKSINFESREEPKQCVVADMWGFDVSLDAKDYQEFVKVMDEMTEESEPKQCCDVPDQVSFDVELSPESEARLKELEKRLRKEEAEEREKRARWLL